LAFNFPIPIGINSIPTLAKHLFPFQFFPIPIPDYLTLINDYVEQFIEIDVVTALSFIRHNTIVLATQIYETIIFKTISTQYTNRRLLQIILWVFV